MIEILISLLISLTILVVVLFGLLVYSKKGCGGKKSEVTLNIYNHNGECIISSKFESVEKAFEFLNENLSSLKGTRYTIE